MASSEYISREAVLRDWPLCDEPGDAYQFIRNFPAADVVEVVRCKDCKYSEHWYRDKRLCRLWYGEEKPSAPIDVFDDGFCNYGERRANDA